MRCGELCKSCVGRCRDIVTPEQPAEIECPECGGDGCEHCKDGWFEVTKCPMRFIGAELNSDIQIITASEHHLPVIGGILDQSAWWFELRSILRSEEHRIESERDKRRNL